MNLKVNFFFDKADQWHDEYAKLREICLSTGLHEELKWGHPCYCLGKSNVVLIHGFKEYCALLLFKGVLMNDPEGILIQQTENVQGPRHLRFTSLQQIVELEDTLKDYIREAIRVERSGLKVEMKKTSDFAVPEEFQNKLDTDHNLRRAFEALTPGRQRGYLYHFSQPKRSETREARVEKFIPHILDGKGLDD